MKHPILWIMLRNKQHNYKNSEEEYKLKMRIILIRIRILYYDMIFRNINKAENVIHIVIDLE